MLIDQLNRSSFPSHLTLEQRLDRLVPGLGNWGGGGIKANKQATAVLAAFALFGVRASEWLDEDPTRVVEQLRQRQDQSNSAAGASHPNGSTSNGSSGRWRSRDPRRAALRVLGLDADASLAEVKQAHRNW